MIIKSCFSDSSTLPPNSQVPQSLITRIYQTRLCNSPSYLTLTWSKTSSSHSLTIHAMDSFSSIISLHQSTFSLFRRGICGSKSIFLNHHHQVKLYWDFTRAKFSTNSAEPKSCFYIAISDDDCIEFFLGDLQELAFRRSNATHTHPSSEPTLLSCREHVFGRKTYVTSAIFLGRMHQIGIECIGGALKVKVDGEVGLVVKKLAWKFRGNELIMIGETEIEFYWDVFDWLAGRGSGGHGVFVFQVGDGGVWPEMVGLEKRLLMRKNLLLSPGISSSSSSSCSSVLQWAEESSDGGRSSCASSTRSYGDAGFSLILYAWNE